MDTKYTKLLSDIEDMIGDYKAGLFEEDDFGKKIEQKISEAYWFNKPEGMFIDKRGTVQVEPPEDDFPAPDFPY